MRKLESLKRRFTLRKIGELDDPEVAAFPGSSILDRVRDGIQRRLNSLDGRTHSLANLVAIDVRLLEETPMGQSLSLRQLALSVSTPNPRTAVIVVKDRGNTERVYKATKREHPNLVVTLMDRDRVEAKLPTVTDDLRIQRGELVHKLVHDANKALKKSELQAYNEIKALSLPAPSMNEVREAVRAEFLHAAEYIETLQAHALDELGLE